MAKGPVWTDAEKALLDTHWQALGSEAMSTLLSKHGYRRTSKACGSMAATRGLRRGGLGFDGPPTNPRACDPKLVARLDGLVELIESVWATVRERGMTLPDGREPALQDIVSWALTLCHSEPAVLNAVVARQQANRAALAERRVGKAGLRNSPMWALSEVQSIDYV